MTPRTAPSRRALRAAFTVLSILAAVVFHQIETEQPASAAVTWNDGALKYSTIINCPSIIGGYPYTEHGLGVGMGSAVDLATKQPVPGQTFYVRVVMTTVGYPCDTNQVDVQFKLPPNVSTAISAADKILCFYEGSHLPANQCPTALTTGSESGYLRLPAPAGTGIPTAPLWPVPVGKTFEFRVPVKATQVMTNAVVNGRIHVIDGYDSPVLRPTAGITVFSTESGPSVSYPSPSTVDITHNSARSRGYFSMSTGGQVYFQIGTTQGSWTNVGGGFVYGSGQVQETWTTWGPDGYALQPSTTYYWRLAASSGGSTVYGPVQQFTTLAANRVVGTGTAASCTTAALHQVLTSAAAATGAEVTFNCGAGNVDIPITQTYVFNKDVTIDGGNKVRLVSQGARHLRFTGGNSTVKGLTLTGADHTGCGGALSVESGATLWTSFVTISGNKTTGMGGGLCVAAGGDLTMTNTNVTANVAGAGGGGGVSSGYLWASQGEWANNTAGGYGGGMLTLAGGSDELRSVAMVGNKAATSNAAATGGAVHSYGSLAVNNSTLSGNEAFKGAAASSTVSGSLYLNSVTAVNNKAQGSGEAGFLHALSSGTTTVRNTLIAQNTPRNCTAPSSGFVTQGHNLEDTNTCGLTLASDLRNAEALVGPLAANGGASRTHALLPGSAAIDAAYNPGCWDFDQRGVHLNFSRLIDGDLDGIARCDIGAYERVPDGTPGAPRNVSATAGSRQANVSWLAPANNGGNAVTGYQVTPYRNGVAQAPVNFTGTSTTRTVTGLTSGVGYTFRVRAVNSAGPGAPSGHTNTVTPTGPVVVPGGMVYVPVAPCRVYDSRSTSAGVFASGSERAIAVSGSGSAFASQGGKAGGCGIPVGASAVEGSITAVSPAGRGFLRAWPAGSSRPAATFVNFNKSESVTNTGAISLRTSGSTHLNMAVFSASTDVVVDVQGYFVPESAAGKLFVPIAPCRIVDTRSGGGSLGPSANRNFHVTGSGSGFALQGGKTGGCGIPAGAAAVEVSVSAVDADKNGFTRVWAAGSAAPTATFLNHWKAGSVTNTGAVPVSGTTGQLTVANFSSRSHYVIDVQGYYVSEASAPMTATAFNPIMPCRIVDTRSTSAGRMTNAAQRSFAVGGSGSAFASQGGKAGGCGIPASSRAVEASFSAVDPSAVGYLRNWPSGGASVTATFLNYLGQRGITNTGAVAVQPNTSSGLTVRNFGGPSDVVIDVQGYFSPRFN